MAYRFQAIYIKFIGTHAQYDQVDATSQAVAYALLPSEGIGSKLFNIG